jgi:hypothetical protein
MPSSFRGNIRPVLAGHNTACDPVTENPFGHFQIFQMNLRQKDHSFRLS